jgi:hypothetical protein
LWWRWEFLQTSEATGVLPKDDGLPVLMDEEECAAANGGRLPGDWGEVQYAWRDEVQKRAFYEKFPERFIQKVKQEKPIDSANDMFSECWACAGKTSEEDGGRKSLLVTRSSSPAIS